MTRRSTRARVAFKDKPFAGAPVEGIVARALNRRCNGCQNRQATIRISTFAPLADLTADQLVMLDATTPGGLPEPFAAKGGERYVRVGEVFICSSCRPAAEKAVARHPSAWFVDIDTGAAPDKPVFRREYGDAGR